MPASHLMAISLAAAMLSACSSNSLGVTTPPMTCASGTRLFNGSCRVECATGPCASGTICMDVDGENPPVCLDYTSCAYLASDSQCVGQSFSSGRGGMETYTSDPVNADPYDVTHYDDTYFEPTDPSDPKAMSSACLGDAIWETVQATNPVACNQPHPVKRCRLVNFACKLIDGTTQDTPSP